MSSHDVAEFLRHVRLFHGFSDADRAALGRALRERGLRKGHVLFHEGDHGDACYIVRRGTCRVTREHPDGRAITLANLGPGAIFGELAMFDGERRSASVEALEDTDLLALPASDVRSLIREHPEMAEKVVVALTRRIRDANERISRQSFQTVPSRVAGVLSRLASEEELSPSIRDGVTIRMTQSDLAQLAGTSRESVSRFLATLERAGVVSVGRARVTVLEPERLGSYIF